MAMIAPARERTDPRVTRTRQLISEAFKALLSEKKFHDISIQDIASRATVNRATFYAHFDDKYALLDQTVRTTFRQEVAERTRGLSRRDLDGYRIFIAATFEALAECREVCQLSRGVEQLVYQTIQEEINLIVLEGVRELLPDGAGGIQPETLASIQSWAIFGAAQDWARSDRSISAQVVAQHVVSLLTEGVIATRAWSGQIAGLS
jgi:AcrR family transcriptional regulator